MSGDPRFAGTIKITTSAVIDNRANLNYLLTHSGLDYKRNILNDRNPVVTEDVEGDKKFIMLKLLNGISYGNDCLMPEIKSPLLNLR
uniref:Channel forming colicin central receptor recognition domain-containing protein n=1 Tax=Escherichia coli TaxID=562 RepID=A0A3G4RTQ0_ECOLX|nr:hypothetical protein D0368_00348 [Escherichia coli]